MRIALDYQMFVLQSYGGISRYFTCLAQGLLDLEQQVKIFAPLHRNNYLSALPQGIVNGRFIKQFPRKTKRLFIAYNHFGCRYKVSKWKPDLVHETYYSRVGAETNHFKTVITVHDMIHELFPNDFPTRDNTSEIKRLAVERADHIICISENTKKDLMRLFGTSANKITVIHHGFDQFSDRDAIPVISLNSRPFLLYVGDRHQDYKNFVGFLRAVATSKRLLKDFEIVAFGSKQFSSTELALIRSLGYASGQVKQVGGDDTLLGEYYSKAKAFVYPSLYEGFGIPPLEAMAHRCPVISSNTSSMPEVIGIAAEYFDPTELENMCHAIENVVYSESRIEELRGLGIERLEHFSWKKCSQETLAVYHSLLGEK